ncbi:MAG: lactate racemase domain-containing protein [Haloarculaceae archaeon]
MPVELPLGDGTVSVSLPSCDVTVLEPPGGDPVDVPEAAREAVADPHGLPLAGQVGSDDDVAIVVTDATRSSPDDVLLDALVAELERTGVDREQISVVAGLGLHRPMTDDEFEDALGEYAPLAENSDPEATVEVGTVEDVPIEIYETVAEADAVLATGTVEPHQYAGFSAGAKTVVVGAGGESQIGYTHGPDLLSRDGVRLGQVEGNPFREFVEAAGDVVGIDFVLNVGRGLDGFVDAAAGEPRAVVRDLAESARDALATEVDDEYDVVVSGLGAPKGNQLYQTTRGATYVVLGANNPLKAGGRVVVPARLTEGAGEGTGERRFYDWLSNATDADELYEEMLEGYEPGAQRAFVTAQTLRRAEMYVTNSEHPEVAEECLMHARDTVEDAVPEGSDVLVLPDAHNTLLV